MRPQEVNGPRDFREGINVTRATVDLAFNHSILGTVASGKMSGGGQGEARVFSPYGTLSTTGIGLFAAPAGQSPFVRLDSTWTYVEPKIMRRWTIGGPGSDLTDLEDRNSFKVMRPGDARSPSPITMFRESCR